MSQLLKYLPLIVTLAGTVGTAFLTPQFFQSHASLMLVLGGLSQVLHAVLPSVFGSPSASAEKK